MSVITFILLLIGTYIFGMMWFKSMFLLAVIPFEDWAKHHKRSELKKNVGLLLIATVAVFALSVGGHALHGNLFFGFYIIILIWSIISRIRYIQQGQYKRYF